jgi:hypothetical protein
MGTKREETEIQSAWHEHIKSLLFDILSSTPDNHPRLPSGKI